MPSVFHCRSFAEKVGPQGLKSILENDWMSFLSIPFKILQHNNYIICNISCAALFNFNLCFLLGTLKVTIKEEVDRLLVHNDITITDSPESFNHMRKVVNFFL